MKVPPISTPQNCNTTSATAKPLSANNSALNTTFQHSPTSNTSTHTNNNNSNSNSNSNSNNNSNLCYEPKSVLDLQRSPSPAGGGTTTKTVTSTPSSDTKSTSHHPPTTAVDLDNLEGWDSILCELGLNDDSNSNNSKLLLSQISPCESHLTTHQVLPDFPSSQPFDHTQPSIDLPSDYATFCSIPYSSQINLNNNLSPFDLHNQTTNINTTTTTTTTSFGLDFLDDLIRGAQAFESNDSQQLHLILARLNQRLRSPVGKPLHRAAFYFKEALQHLTTSPTPPTRLTSYEVVQTIRAHKAFSGISPVSLFSTFAGNQAILESVVDGSSPFIHIIDFDIGFGGHWASFMRELVDKASSDHTSIVLRITAIVPEEFGIESKLVKDNLSQFARDLNLNFHLDFVLIPTFEILSFKSIKFFEGEKIALHLSPGVFNRFSNNSRSGISKFLGDLRSLSPGCIVVVDKEVGIDGGTASFGANFLAGIEFYTGMMESIEVAAGGGGDCLRRIETFVLRPRIFAAVDAAARVAAGRRTTWREAFVTAGMRAVGFSQFADFQAECLLRRAQVGGFQVAKRHGEMMLFWHDRPLVATSAWRGELKYCNSSTFNKRRQKSAYNLWCHHVGP
ncbi:Scarecrow-like protein 15 [Bienertia sinuspersici]